MTVSQENTLASYLGGARGVMVIIEENWYDEQSSTPEPCSLHFTER